MNDDSITSFGMKVLHKNLIPLLAGLFTVFAFLSGNVLVSYVQSSEEPNNFSIYLPMVVRHPPNATWVPLSFNGENVTDLHLDPDLSGHAYASVFFDGLFETFDGGATWTRHQVNARIHDLAVHPITTTTMYLATWSSYGMYWTQNGGDSWEPIPGWPYLSPQLYSVAVHPITPTIMFAGSGNFEPISGEIFKTTNGGQTWYIVSPMFTNAVTFAFDPISPNIIYAGTKVAGVQKSMDAGDTWSPANTGLPNGPGEVRDTHVLLHPDSSLKVYAATSAGVYASDDQAENWGGLWERVDANFLLFDPQDSSTLYLGADDGIYVSFDSGASWFPLGQCGTDTSVTRLAFDPFDLNVIWAGATDGLWQCVL